MVKYPTRDGIPVPIHEVDLPKSKLDLSRPESFDNHHNAWTRRSFGRFLLTRTLRNLESMQFTIPKDVHASLHRIYQPPEFPTKEQALARVRAAYESGEKLKVYDIESRAYILYGLTDGIMQDIADEYQYLRNTKHDIVYDNVIELVAFRAYRQMRDSEEYQNLIRERIQEVQSA